MSPDDDPADVKRVYRRLIATEHPDRNPDASIEKFNAIKEAYELMSDRGGQSGATFEGLGDKAKRDFVKLEDAHAGVSSAGAATTGPDASKTTIALRSLTIYDRIKTVFTARNVSLQNRAAQRAKTGGGGGASGGKPRRLGGGYGRDDGNAGEGGGTRRRVNVESNGRSERCGPLRCDTCVRLFFLAAVYVHTHRTERRRKTRKLITDA